jgi:hypothetical protein
MAGLMPADARARWNDSLYAAAVALALALGLWLFWPTLQLGLFADDYTAQAMLDGTFAAPRSPLDLFNFADGSQNDVVALRKLGSIPWWAPSDFRVSFLRPLSSALWHLDRLLLGRAYAAYHAHSIAAWALLVIAASVFYRRIFTTGVAGLCTLIFAIDDSHHFSVLWLSNRGGIYAVLVGVLGLLAHLRWRNEGLRRYAFLSAGWFCIGLLLGEWVVPMFAYVLAYELLGATGPRRRRALCLLPVTIPAAAFLLARALLGYGARGSGEYVDPGAEPARFALALVQRIPVFVADMTFNVPSSWWDGGSPWRETILDWALIPPSIWLGLPGWRPFHFALGLLAFAALALVLRFCWRGLSQPERASLRWLLLGSALALVPVVGSFPSTRLTVAAFFGLAPLAALLLRQLGRQLLEPARLGLPRWLACYGLAVLVAYLQLLSPLRDNVQARVDEFASMREWVLGAELDPARVRDQRVFLLSSSEFTTTFYFAYIWASHGRPLPRSYYPLTTAPFALDLERVDDQTLRMSPLGGYFLSSGQESMFRSARQEMNTGDLVQLDGMRVESERSIDGSPATLRLSFERSLDDPSQVFLISTPRGLSRFAMPAIGQHRQVPRAAYPNWPGLMRARYEQPIEPVPAMLSFASPPAFVAYEPP